MNGVWNSKVIIEVLKSVYRSFIRCLMWCGMWWYSSTDWIRLWWTSPNAFLRSSRVIIRERCLVRALLMMWAISAVCSNVPDKFGVNPFCIACSTKLFDTRKEYIELRRHEVNTFNGIDSSEMGRKLEGSLASPFL